MSFKAPEVLVVDSQDENDEEFSKVITNSAIKKENEQIFTKLCPKEEYTTNDSCLVDNVEFSVISSKRHCAFCGYQVCNECSQKKRPNPQNQEELVRICDICDENYIRREIKQIDREAQENLENEIQAYERALDELNSDLNIVMNNVQINKTEAQGNNDQLEEEIQEKQQKIDKLNKQIRQTEQKIDLESGDVTSYNERIEQVQKDIESLEKNVQDLKEKDAEDKAKLQEYDSKIQELQTWIASTNNHVGNWAMKNKKFESFMNQKRRNGASTFFQGENTYDVNDNELFRELYEDSDDQDESELNSQQINLLANESKLA